MNPIHQLMDDHELILQVLDKMEKSVQQVHTQEKLEREHWEYFIRFFRDFTDGIHHKKEEELLFPVLVKAGIPVEHGPIGCMLSEHDLGRSCIKQIENSLNRYQEGENTALKDLVEAAEEYLQLLRQHIMKENQVLFMMAERLLSISEKNRLGLQFQNLLSEEENQQITKRMQQGFASLAASYN